MMNMPNRFLPQGLLRPLAAVAAGCLMGAAPLALQAQEQDAAFQHYFDLMPSFNPATAGENDQLNIRAAFQKHAMGYDDAGQTIYAGADMAFQTGQLRHGVGVSFLNDTFGLFSLKRFSVQYAYYFRLFGGVASLGIEGDMLNQGIDGSKADLGTTGDPAFPTANVNGSKFDASAGIYYKRGAWYAGLSAMHLTAPVITVGDTYQYEIKPAYYFTAGYNIKLKTPFFSIVPSMLLQYDGTEFRSVVTGRLVYQKEKKRIYGGVAYSPTQSVAAFVGGSFHGVDLSYSYEAFTNGMGLSAGQHEVTLRYSMDLDLTKKGRNKHKSVRWL